LSAKPRPCAQAPPPGHVSGRTPGSRHFLVPGCMRKRNASTFRVPVAEHPFPAVRTYSLV
jgi:hypothetical protein